MMHAPRLSLHAQLLRTGRAAVLGARQASTLRPRYEDEMPSLTYGSCMCSSRHCSRQRWRCRRPAAALLTLGPACAVLPRPPCLRTAKILLARRARATALCFPHQMHNQGALQRPRTTQCCNALRRLRWGLRRRMAWSLHRLLRLRQAPCAPSEGGMIRGREVEEAVAASSMRVPGRSTGPLFGQRLLKECRLWLCGHLAQAL